MLTTVSSRGQTSIPAEMRGDESKDPEFEQVQDIVPQVFLPYKS